MPIVRDESGKRKYSNISTAHVRDKRLSLKAIGLMTIMLTLPDTWKFSTEGLATLTSDKVDSVRNGLLELERFGYITRQRVRDKGKLKDTVYTLYESPIWDFPTLEKPILEKPILEKQPQSNNSIKYELNEVIIEKTLKREIPENKKPKAYKKSNYEEWKEVYEKLNEQQNKESESETVWQN